MAALDFLFGSNPLPQSQTTNNVTSSLTPTAQEYQNALLKKASEVASEDYQTYGQPRIAGFSGDQTGAQDLIRNSIGSYAPQLTTAGNYLTSAGAGFDQSEFDSYMNPYTDAVVDRIGTLGARNLNEKILPGVNNTFTGAGQFGSGRNAEFTNRAIRDTQDSVLAAQNAALNTGYNTSLTAYNEGQGRKLAAGQQLGGLATTGQNLGLRDAAALSSSGAEQQGQQQKNLDLAYQDFQDQTNYDRKNVDFLSATMRGQQIPTTQTQTGTAPGTQSQQGSNVLGQVAGAGLGLYALSQLFKRGGAVRRSPRQRPRPKKALPKMGRGIGGFVGAKKKRKAAANGDVWVGSIGDYPTGTR